MGGPLEAKEQLPAENISRTGGAMLTPGAEDVSEMIIQAKLQNKKYARYKNLSLIDYVEQEAKNLIKETPTDFRVSFAKNVETPLCVKMNFKTESLFAKGDPKPAVQHTVPVLQLPAHVRVSQTPHRSSRASFSSGTNSLRRSAMEKKRSNSMTNNDLKQMKKSEMFMSDPNLGRKESEGKPPYLTSNSVGSRLLSRIPGRLSNATKPSNSNKNVKAPSSYSETKDRRITFTNNPSTRGSVSGRTSVNVDPMKTAAINGVYKITHDRNARNHVILQKCCINVLKENSLINNVGDYNDDPDKEPIVDVCLIDVDKEKCPKGWTCISTTPTNKPAYILRGTGRRYYLCYRRRKKFGQDTPQLGSTPVFETPTEAPHSTSSSIGAPSTPNTPGGLSSLSFGADSPISQSLGRHSTASIVSQTFDERKSFAEEELLPLDYEDEHPITDIQIKDMHKKSRLSQPGYQIIKHTHKGNAIRINSHCRDGNLESGSVMVAVSRIGIGYVKDITIINAETESCPAGFIELKYCPRGNPASLNRNADDAPKTHLCFAKDCSQYLMRNHELLVRPDLKYLSPLVIACHLQDPVVAQQAIKLLEPLISAGFLQCPENSYTESSCVKTLLRSLCDSTCNWSNRYTRNLVKVFEKIMKLHYQFIEPNNLIDMFIAVMQIINPADRRKFVKTCITVCLEHLAPKKKKRTHARHRARSGVSRRNGVVTFDDETIDDESDGEDGRGVGGSDSEYESDGEGGDHGEGLSSPSSTRNGGGFSDEGKSGEEPEDFIRSMLLKIGKSVELAKKSQKLATVFRTTSILSDEFRAAINDLLDLLFLPDETPHKLTAVVVLMLCKMSLGPMPSEEYKSIASETLDLLFVFVKKLGVNYDPRTSKKLDNLMFILRQFMSTVMAIVLTGYTEQSRTSHRCFDHACQLFVSLWQKFPEQFKVELGNILNQILLPLLDSDLTPIDCKIRILQSTQSILSPQSLADLYYNYDNRQTWLVYERLVDVMCELTNESTPPVREQSEERTIGDKPRDTQFHVKCLDTLCELVKCLRVWYRDIVDKAKLATPTQAVTEGVWNNNDGYIVRPSRARVGTVARRFDDQQTRKKRLAEAIKAANKGGGKALRKAIKALCEDGIMRNTPEEIVKFINTHADELQIEEVGLYLGGSRPKEEMPFEESIRLCFMRHIHFVAPLSPLRLDRAMRILLTDSGFRLPADANPISRLLESFAAVYYEMSDENFANPDAVYLAAYTILMLNTNLHNPSLKDKDRMTLPKFFELTSAVDGVPYGEREWTKIYQVIKKDGYEIPMGAAAAIQDDRNFQRDFDREYMKFVKRLGRKAVGEMKDETAYFRKIYTANSTETGFAMFSVSWSQCLSALKKAIRPADPATVPKCLQGYNDLLQLAIMLKQKDSRDQIAKSLAAFTYQFDDFENETKFQKPPPKGRGNSLRKPIKGQVFKSDSDYLRQAWFLELQQYDNKKVKAACQLVETTIKNAKKHFTDSTNYTKLTAIQNKITNEINIVTNFRAYIGEGDIRKLCADGSHRAYRLFLFGDSIMYASGGPSKYKVHRVLQLAFSGIEDIEENDSIHAFRLNSPQKTVTFFTRNANDKKEWIRAINKAIKRSHKLHQHIVNAAEKLVKQEKQDHSFLDRFRKTSAFVGKTPEMLMQNKLNVYNDRCKLCFKVFSVFNGNKLCAYCLDSNICGNCCKNRVAMKDSSGRDRSVRMRYRVCEGCATMLCNDDEESSTTRV